MLDLLRVGVLFPAAAELTAVIIAAARDECPEFALVEIDVSELGGERALVSDQVDLAFLWSPVVDTGLATVTLFEDEPSLVVATNHALARRDYVTDRELADLPYTRTVAMTEEWRQASTIPAWGGKPDQAIDVVSVADAMQTVADGYAVTVGPRSLQRFSIVQGVRCIPYQGDGWCHAPCALLAWRTGEKRFRVRRFVDLAITVSRRFPALVPGARVYPARQLVSRCQPDRVVLTRREQHVLQLLATGITAKAMGRDLGISSRTVAKHLECIYQKLGVDNRVSAVTTAQRRSLISPDR